MIGSVIIASILIYDKKQVCKETGYPKDIEYHVYNYWKVFKSSTFPDTIVLFPKGPEVVVIESDHQKAEEIYQDKDHRHFHETGFSYDAPIHPIKE